MVFDYAHGKTWMYMVSMHNSRISDFAYFHEEKAAKKFFKDVTDQHSGWEHVFLTDLKTDERKTFWSR